jgi:hypothetical protein
VVDVNMLMHVTNDDQGELTAASSVGLIIIHRNRPHIRAMYMRINAWR